MARSIFGWDLPPGVTHRMIEDAAGSDEPCQCCGKDPAECECPECPVCTVAGNPACYSPGHRIGKGRKARWQCMEYSPAQQVARCKLRIADLRQQLQDEELALVYLQEQLDGDGSEAQ